MRGDGILIVISMNVSYSSLPEFVGVDFTFLLLVKNAKHVAQFFLVLVVLHLLANDATELVKQDVPGTYIHASVISGVAGKFFPGKQNSGVWRTEASEADDFMIIVYRILTAR